MIFSVVRVEIRLPSPPPQKKEKERKDYSRNASCTIHYVILLHFRVSDPYEEYLVYSDATNVDPAIIIIMCLTGASYGAEYATLSHRI